VRIIERVLVFVNLVVQVVCPPWVWSNAMGVFRNVEVSSEKIGSVEDTSTASKCGLLNIVCVLEVSCQGLCKLSD